MGGYFWDGIENETCACVDRRTLLYDRRTVRPIFLKPRTPSPIEFEFSGRFHTETQCFLEEIQRNLRSPSILRNQPKNLFIFDSLATLSPPNPPFPIPIPIPFSLIHIHTSIKSGLKTRLSLAWVRLKFFFFWGGEEAAFPDLLTKKVRGSRGGLKGGL